MASRRNRELQRYHDGELGRRAAEKLRRQIASSPEDQQRLANLQGMGELLREANQTAVEAASFDRLWGRVQVGIAAHQPLSLGERVRLWFRSYGLMAASATAAAVLAIFLWLPNAGNPAARNDCEIENLEADPAAMSTIFTIDDPESGGRTTVIWVNEAGQPVEDDPVNDKVEGESD